MRIGIGKIVAGVAASLGSAVFSGEASAHGGAGFRAPGGNVPANATNNGFKAALDFTLKMEGGLNSNSNDLGNSKTSVTFAGISEVSYQEFKSGLSAAERSSAPNTVKDLARLSDKAKQNSIIETFYERQFWNRGKCNEVFKISPAIAHFFFDTIVNSGISGGTELLQKTVGADPDGGYGPLTNAALGVIVLRDGEEKVLRAFHAERQKDYDAIVASKPAQAQFLKGWTSRNKAALEHALTLLESSAENGAAAPVVGELLRSLEILSAAVEKFKVIKEEDVTGDTKPREEVKALQAILNALMPGKEPLKVDGIFDPKTTAAVFKFQQSAGIGLDGTIGIQSLAEFRKRLTGK